MGILIPLFLYWFCSFYSWNLCDRLATNDFFWYNFFCRRFIRESYTLDDTPISSFYGRSLLAKASTFFFIPLLLYRTSVRVVNHHIDFHIHFSLKPLSFSVVDTYVVIILCFSVYLCFICWVHHIILCTYSQLII